jgi:hypothetical protein
MIKEKAEAGVDLTLNGKVKKNLQGTVGTVPAIFRTEPCYMRTVVYRILSDGVARVCF